MHELSLYSTVSSAAHSQVLQILAGISATFPTQITERHLIFRPRKKGPNQGPKVGGSQGLEVQKTQSLQSQGQGELFYLQLIGEIEDGSSISKEKEDEVMKDAEETTNYYSSSTNKPVIDLSTHKWHLRFSDVPEVGKRPVTSRLISATPLASGDILEYMDSLGYE
jgi:mediator of RNA polymerase II transcription subunit 18